MNRDATANRAPLARDGAAPGIRAGVGKVAASVLLGAVGGAAITASLFC